MLALEPAAAPPFAMWFGGAFALIVTELFRLWSDGAPLRLEPWTTAGAADTGMAGAMLGRPPFTGDAEEDLPFWVAGTDEPTTRGGLVPAAISGVGVDFFVAPAAEAYDAAAVDEEFDAWGWCC